MSSRKLTLADQALANVLIFLAVQVQEDAARTDMALAELPALLPQASPEIPAMARLVHAGFGAMAAGPRRRAPEHSGTWAGARLDLCAAVADFAFWRAGLALDALRTTTPDRKGDAA